MLVYKKIGHSDPIYAIQLGHLMRFCKYHQFIEFSMISFLYNFCEIYEMEIHSRFMCIWLRL